MRYTNVFASDKDALTAIIRVYCDARDPVIADLTYNSGTMWRGAAYAPLVKCDIAPHSENVRCDHARLPLASGVLDCAVFDPPHIPSSAARGNASRIWESRYGITDDPARDADHVGGVLLAPIQESYRVLKADGILIVKIADIVHSHKYQPQHVMVANMAQSVGFAWIMTAVKVRQQAMESGIWQTQKSLRNSMSFFLIFRKGNRHEGTGDNVAPKMRTLPLFDL